MSDSRLRLHTLGLSISVALKTGRQFKSIYVLKLYKLSARPGSNYPAAPNNLCGD